MEKEDDGAWRSSRLEAKSQDSAVGDNDTEVEKSSNELLHSARPVETKSSNDHVVQEHAATGKEEKLSTKPWEMKSKADSAVGKPTTTEKDSGGDHPSAKLVQT